MTYKTLQRFDVTVLRNTVLTIPDVTWEKDGYWRNTPRLAQLQGIQLVSAGVWINTDVAHLERLLGPVFNSCCKMFDGAVVRASLTRLRPNCRIVPHQHTWLEFYDPCRIHANHLLLIVKTNPRVVHVVNNCRSSLHEGDLVEYAIDSDYITFNTSIDDRIVVNMDVIKRKLNDALLLEDRVPLDRLNRVWGEDDSWEAWVEGMYDG
jgi:hypothetical protein